MSPWVTAVIQRHFGLVFHHEHVRRILTDRLNWSSQRPQRQHPDGGDAAIAPWLMEEFPRILDEAARSNAHLLRARQPADDPALGRGRAPPGGSTANPLTSKAICELVKRRLLEDVQYLAGHASPRTTRLYGRRQKKVTRNIVERTGRRTGRRGQRE